MGLISIGVSLMLLSIAFMVGVPLLTGLTGSTGPYGDYLKQLDPIIQLLSNSSLGNFTGLREQIGLATNPIGNDRFSAYVGPVLSLMPLVFIIGLILTAVGVVRRVARSGRAKG